MPQRSPSRAGRPSSWKGGATPPLVLRSPAGEERDLASLRGKVVLVNFWATWCAPCRGELPSLEQLRDALRGRPFEVLAVNVNEGDSRVKPFLAEVPLRLPVLLDRTGDVRPGNGARSRPE